MPEAKILVFDPVTKEKWVKIEGIPGQWPYDIYVRRQAPNWFDKLFGLTPNPDWYVYHNASKFMRQDHLLPLAQAFLEERYGPNVTFEQILDGTGLNHN